MGRSQLQCTPWHYEYNKRNGTNNSKNCAYNTGERCTCRASLNHNFPYIGKLNCEKFERRSGRLPIVKNNKTLFTTIFSGIAGAIITIAYQHFFANSQSFIFIYNGEEVLVTESNYLELTEENIKLNNDINKLQSDYHELEISKSIIET